MLAKLAYHTDVWDVYEDLKNGVTEIAVFDIRTKAQYEVAHIPGASNFPFRLITQDSTGHLDRAITYVVYCDGIGCNASTKGAYALSELGFKVKELLGGLDFWKRDGYPVVAGMASGSLIRD